MLSGNNNASVVAELRMLRAELENIKANTQASAQHSSKSARILERVTQGGESMQVVESV
jgi:hypothetical protein